MGWMDTESSSPYHQQNRQRTMKTGNHRQQHDSFYTLQKGGITLVKMQVLYLNTAYAEKLLQ